MHRGRTLPPAATPIGSREIISGVCGIFHGQQELDRFESELKEHFGVKHCFLVSSGKAAFTLILLALKELFPDRDEVVIDRKSTRLNSSHGYISYAVFCLKKKNRNTRVETLIPCDTVRHSN